MPMAVDYLARLIFETVYPGDKLDAVQIVRQETGWGLGEVLRFVDAHIDPAKFPPIDENKIEYVKIF